MELQQARACFICFLCVSGYKPTRTWEIKFLSQLGKPGLIRVLWGAAVQPVDEFPGLSFGLAFASKHLVLVTQTAVPSHRGLPGFPVSYQQ